MFMIILIPVCLTIHNMPMPTPMLNSLKRHTNIGANVLKNNDVSWEKTVKCKNIINKYFKNNNVKQYENNDDMIYGEIFKIFGYPATLVVINNKFNSVEEFIINKNLIMMFDASPIMRRSFYTKFKNININKALNKKIFLVI
mgnify:FL=1